MLRKLPWALVPALLLMPLAVATFAARSMAVHAAERASSALVEDEETPLETAMLSIQDGLKSLRRSLRKADEDPAPTLALLDKLQADSVSCKAMVPAKEADLPEGERAAFRAAYRQEMLVFLGQLIELEQQVLAGDFDAAGASLKKVRGMEDPSHERFMKDF